MTDVVKLRNSDQKLYLLAGREQDEVTGMTHTRIVGGIKVGTKKLFVRTDQGVLAEIEPLCCLDFYVHESAQRKGVGRLLFDHMLEAERVVPGGLAYDRPSPKLIEFLAKHYNLRNFLPQNNSFVVFNDYYRIRPGTQSVQRVPLHLLKQGLSPGPGHRGVGLSSLDGPTPKKLLPSLSEMESHYSAIEQKATGPALLFKSPVPLPPPPMQPSQQTSNLGNINMMSKLLPSNTLLEQKPDFYSQGKTTTLRPISPPTWQQQTNGKNPLSPTAPDPAPNLAHLNQQMMAAMSNSPASLSQGQVPGAFRPPRDSTTQRPQSPASRAGMAPSQLPSSTRSSGSILQKSVSIMQKSGAATMLMPLAATGPHPPYPHPGYKPAVPATPMYNKGIVPATPAYKPAVPATPAIPNFSRQALEPFHSHPHPHPHPHPQPAPLPPPPPAASHSNVSQSGPPLQTPAVNGQTFGQRWSRNNGLPSDSSSHNGSNSGPRLATIPDNAVFTAPPPSTNSNGARGDSLDGFKADATPRGNTPHPLNNIPKSGPSFSCGSQVLSGGSRTVATPSVSSWKMEFESTKWNKSMDMMGGPDVGRSGSVSKDAMKSSAINAASSALNNHLSAPTHKQVGIAQRAGTLRLT